ncbi:hypothetical protein SmJEL517_g02901 [Synchytrium microbalum]|uniref:Uncharacterized protein n=1 Tax=Synchytrium microbalum TaxID=1806994 RepID=A0A507BYW6_9FUNG|nr:uncharacterized protein SmJEL517_g02901 [Synchytrium microbalum]TPX34470.1 hypothetical protein SmJEL517_g02901 [Synchytrium microbalum]
MRVVIKGGVWKNTEDEILKAAVMKYGKNQWARISSLLVRKTPKQCKARWYEWLDPSIKKTEWSKEEDEKLLHLAKLMPTQWRTIAPIVGRTSAQCLERYQKLLDEAEAKDGEDDGPNADDVRKLRPGEIDPEPEAKPARPDPVDMDEDEKEMLSEARARLANTQGKKAKRKAREKQLEEARRLASLQKRRELKAAGIDMRKKKQKTGMDYNADIPFYTPAAAGFWDTSDERDRESKAAPSRVNVLLSTLEGKRRSEVEDGERKKDAKRQKTQKEAGTYVPPSAVKAAAMAQQMSQRNRLVLPAPQMGEADLEELVKLGYEGEAVKAIVGDDGDASKSLLGDYSLIRTNQPTRTPRATATNDNIRVEARNLRAMTEAQTPLLGGSIDVTPFAEGGTGFEGITPRRAIMQTPNPLAAQLTPRAGGPGVSMTPRDFGTPRSVAGSTVSSSMGSSRVGGGRTPLRDEMGINTPRDDYGGSFEDTPRSVSSRGRQNLIREQLASHFASLPKPKNDFEIVLPDRPSANDDDSSEPTVQTEDAADILAQRDSVKRAEETSRLERRSSAVKRDLPRPVMSSTSSTDIDENETDPERLIQSEVERRLGYDAVYYPAAGQSRLTNGIAHVADESYTDDDYVAACQLLKDEVAATEPLDDTLYDSITSKYTYLRTESAYVETSKVTDDMLISHYEAELNAARLQMSRDATAAGKLEKKLSVMLGGYQSRAANLHKTLTSKFEELMDARAELNAFSKLRQLELDAAESRMDKLKQEVVGLERQETDGQERYKQLLEEREALIEQGL